MLEFPSGGDFDDAIENSKPASELVCSRMFNNVGEEIVSFSSKLISCFIANGFLGRPTAAHLLVACGRAFAWHQAGALAVSDAENENASADR